MHIINWIKRRPTLLFTLAFGLFSFVVLSLMNNGDSSSKATKAVAEVGETVDGVVTGAKEVVGDAVTAVGDATNTVVEKVKDVDLSIAPKLESTVSNLTDTGEATTAASEASSEKPTETAATSEERAENNESVESGAAAVSTETDVAKTTTATEATAKQAVAGEASDGNTALVNPEFGEAKPEELLLMAREAYWNNGLDESAQIYQQLITLEPEKVEYRGELGNVFWRQGFPKKAAELYASIALPMIEDGDGDRVANMVGFIGLYYPEKATEIHNRLQAIQ